MKGIRAIRRSWNQFTENSKDYRILSNAGVVAAATIVVYVVHAVKDLCVAAKFGTGDEIEAFLIAYLLPTFLVNTIAGSIPSALIPVFAKVKERNGEESGLRLVSLTFVCAAVLLSLVSVVLLFLGPFLLPMLASGFSNEKIALTESIFYMLLPLVLIQGLCCVVSATLNAYDKFAVAALVPSLPSVLILVALLMAGDSINITMLVHASVGGAVLQLLLLINSSARMNLWVAPKNHPALSDVGKQYWPLVAAVFVNSANPAIDQAMAATLVSGSVAALGYGDRVVSVVISIGGCALGSAILPHFSRQIALERWLELRKTLQRYSFYLLLFSLPLILIFFFWSEEIVGVLWERGAFTRSDTQRVSEIQKYYSLRIPFYIIGILFVRMLSGMAANRIIFLVATANLVLNIILNLLFMKWWGVTGLALSTSAVYVFSCAMLGMAIIKCWPKC